MAEKTLPVRGAGYVFAVNLIDQSNTKLFKANPTLASGDVKVSKDGGAFANLNTLPTVTPASGRRVEVTLSATEMTADEVHVVFVDAAGAEWCDLSVTLYPATRALDAYATAAKLLSYFQSALRKDVTVDADIGGNYDDATDSQEAIRDRGDAAWSGSAGAGAISWPYTLTSTVDATPIADAEVWVTTDLAGTNVVASGRTNTLGIVTFQLDAGTYYYWRQKAGWNFTNPDTEVVA